MDSFQKFFEKEYSKALCYKKVNIAGILFIDYFQDYYGIWERDELKKRIKNIIKFFLILLPFKKK